MSFNITVKCGKLEYSNEFSAPVKLTDAIANSGFYFDSPCGGRGVCGKCKVTVHGEISPPHEREIEFLGDSVNSGIRLACYTTALGDCDIEIHETGFFKTGSGEYRHVSFAPERYGCAVDIGTTTIILKILSLDDGTEVYSHKFPNPQSIRGADVLTRIEYCSKGGLNELKSLAEKAIFNSITQFGKKIEFFVITGNTAMLHIFSGRNPKGFATAPFEPQTNFGFWEDNCYFMKCPSAYIGADTVASIIASEITKSSSSSALLDIGTNNECVLWNGKRLFACSSPAGPAFEGGNISCGVSASKNGIYKIDDKRGIPEVFTLENVGVPDGICGSGLIDAAAFLLENGYISADGSPMKPFPAFNGIRLLPKDIAELQLAKSAVCAGLLTLCDYASVGVEKLNRIYLTGNFGNRINPKNAEKIGLIPKNTAKITFPSKGTAIDGASAVVLNAELLKESERIAESIETIELSDSSFFADAFIKNLYF